MSKKKRGGGLEREIELKEVKRERGRWEWGYKERQISEFKFGTVGRWWELSQKISPRLPGSFLSEAHCFFREDSQWLQQSL